MPENDLKNNTASADVGRWQWSRLLRTKDWLAVWLGFFLLLIGSILYFPQVGEVRQKLETLEAQYHQATRTNKLKTVAWYQLADAKKEIKARNIPAGKWLQKFSEKPRTWSGNPLDAFFMTEEKVAVKKNLALAKYERARLVERSEFDKAVAAEKAAETVNFENSFLNRRAKSAIMEWRNSHIRVVKLEKDTKISAHSQFGYLVLLGVACVLFFGIGIKVMGESFSAFAKGFTFIFGVSLLAYVCAGEQTLKYYGVGYAPCAIAIGMLISNTVGTPKWVHPAVQTEYYIKTGLVLLGAQILFEKIVVIGTPGVFVAWVVTPIVWLVTYRFGLKVVGMKSKRLTATICSDMSVCGISAAIATAEACKAKDEELTLAVGLSQVFTSVMSVITPMLIKLTFPLDKQMILGGAWLGGTIDSTGSVAASGAVLGEKALYVAATIKMIQNILIGVIAFFVAIYFASRVESEESNRKLSVREIWYRFPKFVLGFIAASVVFSGCYSFLNGQVSGMGYSIIDQGIVKGMADLFRSWFFCFSFVSIGLAINFRNLREHFAGGKPLILYASGQTLNMVLTLLAAYLMFYVAFPSLTASI